MSTEGVGGVDILLKVQGKTYTAPEMLKTNGDPHLGLRV